MCFAISAVAQFSDDFADGSLTTNPSWSGTDSKFTVSANRLKLQAPAVNDHAYLSTPSESINDASWEFFVRLEFNPSSSNYTRVYLTSSQADLSGGLNGYFVGIGNASDEISLYKQFGTTIVEIIDGLDNRLNLSTSEMKVKVTRDDVGNWTLFTDVGLTGYSTEGDTLENSFTASNYTGIYCAYTSTRSDKFYFDDFTVTGDPFVDDVPPEWQAVTVLSSTELLLEFSEPLDPASVSSLSNYDLFEIGTPVSAVVENDSDIILTFDLPFPNGYEQSLTISNLADTAGNVITESSQTFLYFQENPVSYRDIIMTEIFPDFSPVIGLPEGEFVELYNRSDHPVQLSGWKITDGSSVGTISATILVPGSYVILTNSAHAGAFEAFGSTVTVANFPTLNNSSDFLLLKDDLDQPIDSVRYYATWFGDDDKKQGGWTLELIDPENICKGDENWTASNDNTGGTPGRINSVNETIIDLEGPHLLAAESQADNVVLLTFDEKLENDIPDASQILFNPALTISEVSFFDASLKALRVSLSTNPQPGKSYLVTVDAIRDCPGNVISEFNQVVLNPDSIAPSIDSVAVLSQNSVLLRFDELVLRYDAELQQNYSLGDQHPLTAAIEADDRTIVLTFERNFENGVTEQLTISNIHDINGNVSSETVSFLYFEASEVHHRDIVISEIFPDPMPAVGLPEAEFVEIYNRSPNPIDLTGWILTDGTSKGTVSFKIIQPGAFAILTPSSVAGQFHSFGEVVSVSQFPSLNNSSDRLVLMTADSMVVDSVEYTNQWYKDEDKEDGGWTLELRDPENVCLSEENWMPSTHEFGGTPGQRNSVDEVIIDEAGPKLINAIVDTTSLQLVFDERLNHILPTILFEPQVEFHSLAFTNETQKAIRLTLAHELESHRSYSVTVSDLLDCAGNPIDADFDQLIIYPDSLPPVVDSVGVVSNLSITLRFNEQLLKASAENLENYLLNAAARPQEAVLINNDYTIRLTFNIPFQNGLEQTLTFRNLADVNGNAANDSVKFTFFLPSPIQYGDVIITEVFPDPSPVVGLPESEFVEIFNRSENPINLQNWNLTDGGTEGKLADIIILPHEYAILCSSSNTPKFKPFGKTIAVSSFPSLNNIRDTLFLRDPERNVVDVMTYSSDMYHDEHKADGGWTLEMINPQDLCSGNSNWSAAIHSVGGTPGKQNSIFSIHPDVTGPALVSVTQTDSVTIELQFNEKLGGHLPDIATTPLAEIFFSDFGTALQTSIVLRFANELQQGKTLSITMSGLQDCAGNISEPITAILNPDSIPPVIEEVLVLSANKLSIAFSEALNSSTVTPAAFVVEGFTILRVELLENLKMVEIEVAENFGNGIQNRLSVYSVHDINGNPIEETTLSFMLFEAKPVQHHDLRITEVFADPSPAIGLPEVEYVEIYNRSSNAINLQNFRLSDGSSAGKILSGIILPSQYLILTSSASVEQFSTFGKVAAVTNFPTLNNSGDVLVLQTASQFTIDSINYAASWYQDEDKAAGGYSLEIIDPQNLCAEEHNWIASESESGGTPGIQNSVFSEKPDLAGPKLIDVIAESDSVIRLHFDEKLSMQLPTPASVQIEGATVTTMGFTDGSLRNVSATLAERLKRGSAYQVDVSGFLDCAGNEIQQQNSTGLFGLQEIATINDIVINEILFNPRPTGVDFLEIYNRSEKFINLKAWSLAKMGEDTMQSVEIITEHDLVLAPKSYLVFTPDENVLKGEYPQSREETFFEVVLPSMNDDEGNIMLMDSTSAPIDHLNYSDDFHSVFVKNDEGVSIERVSMNAPSLEADNWRSATEQSGFATPGFENGSSISTPSLTNETVLVEPRVFEPVSGQPNFTLINYQFEKAGFIANVKVADAGGRIVKTLAENVMLNADGFIRWDGDQDNGSKARIGSYMIWFQVFDEQGTVHTIRKPVAVAGKF